MGASEMEHDGDVPAYGTPDGGAEGAAYVVGADLRTIGGPALGVVVGMVLGLVGVVTGFWFLLVAPVLGLYPLYRHHRDAERGVRYFAVDAAGVYLGEAVNEWGNPDLTVLTPWDSVTSLVLFEYRQRARSSDDNDRWVRAVGVSTSAAEGTPADGGFVHFVQPLGRWRLDRDRLEAAVRHHRPEVPVVDGPTVDEERVRELVSRSIRALGVTE
jgi:hypothetical protein